MDALSESIKEKVNSSGFTQKQIAEKLGMTEGAFSLRLNGKREFRASEVCAIAEMLQTSVTELLGLNEGK